MPHLILIVDDHLDSATYLARLLTRVGYNVSVYPCGAELLAQVGRVTPRLVILDVMMPGMNGVECLRHIRQSAEWADVPVVMYSADFNYERMKEAERAGAQEHIVKGTILWPSSLLTVQKYAGEPQPAPQAR